MAATSKQRPASWHRSPQFQYRAVVRALGCSDGREKSVPSVHAVLAARAWPAPSRPSQPQPHENCRFRSVGLTRLALDQLELEPTIDWAAGLRQEWTPGKKGAQQRLQRFIAGGLTEYETGRDEPGADGVSQLSPHLHFGEISPRQIWHAVQDAARANRKTNLRRSAEAYLRQLGWREFAYHLLFHAPQTCGQPLREKFARFAWRDDPDAMRAWQRGRTGHPLVDAGMRQLWKTGWMHNRVRMVVASFLIKHLMLSWQSGSRWFWDTLVDADLANNTLGWQWTAGCGADAAPFFRIFNPMSQGEKFDPDGTYVRRWVSELARLPNEWVHRPWETPPSVLAEAGIKLGRDYPWPIVDHAEARQRALEEFARIKG